jgi:activator of HSP90 ATPase
MGTKTITIKDTFKTNLTQLYNDWLSSEGHTAITGGEATASKEKGVPFTAWDGYIEGVNLELEENKRIVQSWRTMEFNVDDKDSQIEILLEDDGDGVQFTLTHSNIPEGNEEKYKLGWEEHYLQPMSQYYNNL